VVRYCRPTDGIWVDLGSGSGSLAFALTPMTTGTLILIDPNCEALLRAAQQAKARGLTRRLMCVAGVAENMPLRSNSVNLVVSRGSIFFWQDRPAGLRDVYRVLRPGGKAMIGGGVGSGYPLWARRVFTRRRLEGVQSQGEDAMRSFREARSSETFSEWARMAGLTDFEVIREEAHPEQDGLCGLGVWLIFGKEAGQSWTR